ncbi:MAG: GNAT family N-acetyltransferase [Actinobacteria bacterium]|nr:GNAT family N-acetyltransferase [Actinomycetota bacterium]
MIEIRTMEPGELELVDRHLPLDRLDQPGGEWLVAWQDGTPVGHLHLDWRADPPEVQGVFVAETHRRRSIASLLSAAAEDRARARGFNRIALDVDVESVGARALYEKLGYRERGTPPRRHAGTIMLRGKPFSFDVVLLDLVKEL